MDKEKETEDEEQAGGEDYCYCEQCGGLLPCSSGPHPHKGREGQ